MAVLLDTSAVVLLMRRSPSPETSLLREAALQAAESGRALLSAITTAELFVGEGSSEGRARLREALSQVPAVAADGEVASMAGEMGAFLRGRGAQIPFPDLLVAATAIFLGLPLLTWDSDFARAKSEATGDAPEHERDDPGRAALGRLVLHPASRLISEPPRIPVMGTEQLERSLDQSREDR